MQASLSEKWTGADFRAWREDLRLTQAEAAALLGVTRRSVQNWEMDDAPVAMVVALACRFVTEHQAGIGAALVVASDAQKTAEARIRNRHVR